MTYLGIKTIYTYTHTDNKSLMEKAFNIKKKYYRNIA